MIIKVSMDRNVTSSEAIEFLKEVGVLDSVNEGKMYEENKTLFLDIEIKPSEIGTRLKDVRKEDVYLSNINEKGISLFSLDNSNIRCFIPMSNVLSINFEENLK